MGNLKNFVARTGGLGAALAITATAGVSGASANTGYHDRTLLYGNYGTVQACDQQGRGLVDDFYRDTQWFTERWECSEFQDSGLWELRLYQVGYF